LSRQFPEFGQLYHGTQCLLGIGRRILSSRPLGCGRPAKEATDGSEKPSKKSETAVAEKSSSGGTVPEAAT
jgi:hypothetical protein